MKFTAENSQNFRHYLQSELVRRCRSNPKYSLRAFARALNIEPSALSKIIHGKRAISQNMFSQLSKRLNLSPQEVESMSPRSTSREPEYRNLTLDLFSMIADWYHYAILELTLVEGFEPSAKWIAKSLGITISEVNVAVERLQRLELLTIDKHTGKWIDHSGAITTVGNDFTAVAFRRLQVQVLRAAITALEELPMSERDQSSMTMAANSKLLPEAKEKIKRFRRSLCKFLKSKGPYDTVYQLGISLYPLTTKACHLKGELK